MQKATIKIEIQETDKGNIRIKFTDGGSYLVPDVPENFGLISALEVELKYALLNKTQQP